MNSIEKVFEKTNSILIKEMNENNYMLEYNFEEKYSDEIYKHGVLLSKDRKIIQDITDAESVIICNKEYSIDEMDDLIFEHMINLKCNYYNIYNPKYYDESYVTKIEYEDYYDFLVDNNFDQRKIEYEKDRLKYEDKETYIYKFKETFEKNDWLGLIIGDETLYKYLPDKLKKDKEFILKFLDGTGYYINNISYKFFYNDYRKAYKFATSIRTLSLIDKELLNDEFIEECVKKNPFIFLELPKELQNDKLKKIALEDDIFKYGYQRKKNKGGKKQNGI